MYLPHLDGIAMVAGSLSITLEAIMLEAGAFVILAVAVVAGYRQVRQEEDEMRVPPPLVPAPKPSDVGRSGAGLSPAESDVVMGMRDSGDLLSA